jgi:hypothetical protein
MPRANLSGGEVSLLPVANLDDVGSSARMSSPSSVRISDGLSRADDFLDDFIPQRPLPEQSSENTTEPCATPPSAFPLAQPSPKSSATLDPSNLTAVKPITTPLGQIIEVLPQAAICWLEVAPGRRVRTEVPLEKLSGIALFPEIKFCIEVDSTNREVRYSPLQRDMSLDDEFERMCREFEEWRAQMQADDSKQE